MPNTVRKISQKVWETMGQTCILTGMILDAMPVGEYDKRITILTLERGKVTAFARGARRPKNALQAGTNLFCFGRFEAYEGRSSYTVIRAQIQNYFRELTTDLELTYYGCYFLEVANYFSMENDDCTGQLKLLYQTLRALLVKSLDHRLVRCIYELRSLVNSGVYPNVFSCSRCGSKEQLHTFSIEERGILCDRCCPGKTRYFLDDAAVYALQYIITVPLKSLYTFTVKEEVLTQISRIIHKYMNLYVEKEFKTLAFLPET